MRGMLGGTVLSAGRWGRRLPSAVESLHPVELPETRTECGRL
jgi:hypothetical protein